MTYLPSTSLPSGSTTPASRANIISMIRAGRPIVSVANTTERGTVYDQWATSSGSAPSTSNPVIVWRRDADVIELNDGTGWRLIATLGDTGWRATNQIETGWTMATYYRVIGGVFYLAVDWTRTGGAFTNTNLGLLTASIGGPYAPSRALYSPSIINQHSKISYMAEITTAGVVTGIGVNMEQNHRLRGLITWPIG